MTDKALISNLTWRSLDMQKSAFKDMPIFTAPDEIETLLRPTTRKDRLFVHVMSLAVIADNGDDFESFWRKLPKNSAVRIQEENLILESSFPIKKAKALWLSARKFGSARIGADISAKNRREKSAEGIAKIKERWPQPSGVWPTFVLLKEAGVSLNTAKAHLGRRPIAQANYEAAQKRKARRQEAGRV